MSAEVGSIALILKYVWMPVIGMLGWFTKSYLNKLDTRLTLSEEKVGKLELELNKNYYDKLEIQQHIVVPLQTSIAETREELKAQSTILSEIHSDLRLVKHTLLKEDKP